MTYVSDSDWLTTCFVLFCFVFVFVFVFVFLFVCFCFCFFFGLTTCFSYLERCAFYSNWRRVFLFFFFAFFFVFLFVCLFFVCLFVFIRTDDMFFRFGLTTFRTDDILDWRRFGLKTFWTENVSDWRRFGLNMCTSFCNWTRKTENKHRKLISTLQSLTTIFFYLTIRTTSKIYYNTSIIYNNVLLSQKIRNILHYFLDNINSLILYLIHSSRDSLGLVVK